MGRVPSHGNTSFSSRRKTRPACEATHVPFSRSNHNAFEGCLRSEARDELGLLALAHRIQALVEHGSRFLVPLTRGLQAHAGVRTICDGLLAPREAVVPAPVARPIGVHEQHEAAAVAQLVRLLAWLRLLALHVGESFESAHLMVSGRGGTARDARYHQKYQQK